MLPDFFICNFCAQLLILQKGELRAPVRSDIEKLKPRKAYWLGLEIAYHFEKIAEARKALAEYGV